MAESIIKNNLAEIHARIEAACARAGRDPSEVGLICVSKTKPAEAVLEAYTAGEKLFGENKVQEIREKAPVLPEDIQWHMIGHLQTNKVKQVIGHAAMIHGIDSVRLAETVSKEAVKSGIVMPVLIEVNMAAEESKYGIRPEEWGRGYATAALSCAIRALFSGGFSRVVCGAFEENTASRRVMEKCGMVRAGREEAIEYRGAEHRCIYYEIHAARSERV